LRYSIRAGGLAMRGLKKFLYQLYESDSAAAHRFRYGLLAFDLITIIYLIATSFQPWRGTETIDAVIGILLALDFAARLWLSSNRRKQLSSFWGVVDLIVIASFLAPLAGEGLGFLRVLRILRIGHSYKIMRRLKDDFPFIQRNEQTVIAALNLVVCIFVMTALVYETQRGINDKIIHYGDAFYFTVTAITTTGFGDITLVGPWGRTLSIIIMLCGVTLFLRLVQTALRPNKVEHTCQKCGLSRHDHDAVCCKACGEVINIRDDGAV
jgi:voltage-gated potassium channel